jgi:hypothetical protein
MNLQHVSMPGSVSGALWNHCWVCAAATACSDV